jgi:GTP-binding protein
MSSASQKDQIGPKVLDASFVLGVPAVAKMPAPTLTEVAFAGRSNVGKSSLLNTLMQRAGLARTSSTPGCTRALNVFEVKLSEDRRFHFVDLPGYGYAKVSRAERMSWGAMIEDYLRERASLRALFLLVDARRGIEEDDLQLLDFMAVARPKESCRVHVVATKLDKIVRAKQKPALEAIKNMANVPVVGFSSETGTGRDELWRRIEKAAQHVDDNA